MEGLRSMDWAGLIPALCCGLGLLDVARGGEEGREGSIGAGDRLVGFERRELEFENHLGPRTAERNRILENGSGVAAGDVDGDGRCDLYFCGLESDNALYRNLGGWRFEEIAAASGVACPGQYSTGAALADLDGDGDLDLLVNGVGSGTRCFLNSGDGQFEEVRESGLERDTGAMSMALADVDSDGDLDLYVANYRSDTWKDIIPGLKPRVVRKNGKRVAEPEDRFAAEEGPGGQVNLTEVGEPDRLYLNDGGGRFEGVDWVGGRFLDEEGTPLRTAPRHWGLAAQFRDMNLDGLPDLYVCNDFLWGGDDVWINQGGESFQRIARLAIRHTSWSSMAVDFADIDRDGKDDFFVADMLSRSHQRRMRQRANFEAGVEDLPVGEIEDRPQYQQNTLFWNRGDGTYAEIANYAGIDATEWTWGCAFLDVDLDGYEDLLIANGNAHDLIDSDATFEAMGRMSDAASQREALPRTLLMYPRLELANLAFRNRGDRTFEDRSAAWGFDEVGISQGMCLADLDGDGDLDVAVNNLQSRATVHENLATDPRVAIRLKGRPPNTRGIGARIRVRSRDGFVQSQEMVAGGRYLSSDESMRVFGLPPDRGQVWDVEVIWSSGRRSEVRAIDPGRILEIEEQGEEAPVSGGDSSGVPLFEDVSHWLEHRHRDSRREDRQALLPRYPSQFGSGVAWGDLNRDGWPDLVGSGGGRLAIFYNQSGEGFRKVEGPELRGESIGLGILERRGGALILVGESNYVTGSPSDPSVIALRLDRRGRPSPEQFLPGQSAMVGPLVLADFDRDGDLDLFAGSRLRPGHYPESVTSRIFSNRGWFRLDLAESRKFAGIGMVSGAVAGDVDGDGDSDLLLACDWGAVQLWENDSGSFREVTGEWGLAEHTGGWCGIDTGDFNGDGQLDFAATNWGLNTPYQRYRPEPIQIHYGNFDADSWTEFFESGVDSETGQRAPLRDLAAIGSEVPRLQTVFRSFRSYSETGLSDLIERVGRPHQTLEMRWLASSVFLNRGDHFEIHPLPAEAQWTAGWGINTADFNSDGEVDLFLSQNLFGGYPENGRQDAGMGLVLLGRGDGSFEALAPAESGIRIAGEQRGSAVADFNRDGRPDLVVVQNAGPTRLFLNRSPRAGMRVRLAGAGDNPSAIGARIRLRYADYEGPAVEIRSGSGYGSRSSPVALPGLAETPESLWIRWPDGREQTVQIGDPGAEVIVPEE